MIRLLLALLLVAGPLAAQPAWPASEGRFTLRDFRFASGETLPELRLAYRTLGTPKRDASGQIANAVLILHGTGGSGAQFLRPQFAGELFGPGQPLDIRDHFIILPDAIGHGGSSKPSDGLRARFPAYDYADMVEAQRRLLVEHLGVTRLKLLIGTSMGCMHAFEWGVRHPGFARALFPLACLPVEIAGRNRMWRTLAMEAIRADPAWNGGAYTTQPQAGLRAAASLLVLAGAAPVRLQAEAPTRLQADRLAADRVAASMQTDANDLLFQLDSSRSYNPAPHLARITVPVTWVNSADDLINPPGLGIAEREVGKMPNARFVLIPETADTRGHSTHTWAIFWKEELKSLLARAGS
jgi:homoserine O-acetyltransferase